MYKLYKITNKINNKLYIGITKLELSHRFDIHCSKAKNPKYPIQHAIVKYGRGNFEIELILENESKQYVSDLEEPTINEYKSHIDENGYNVAKGGYGGDLGEDANRRRRETIANKSEEEKAIIKKIATENSSKPFAERMGAEKAAKIREKMSQKQKLAGGYGPKKHRDETKTKMSKASLGKQNPNNTNYE